MSERWGNWAEIGGSVVRPLATQRHTVVWPRSESEKASDGSVAPLDLCPECVKSFRTWWATHGAEIGQNE
jgi:hypothetical protein